MRSEPEHIHYTPDAFLADAWQGPKDGSGFGWPLAEIRTAHADAEVVALTDYVWGFISREAPDGLNFLVRLFEVDGFDPDGTPGWGHPIAEVLGTTFDGVRETHGAPCFSTPLASVAEALLALDRLLEERGWELP